MVAVSLSSVVLLAVSTVLLHSVRVNQRMSETITQDEVSHRFAAECLRVLQLLDSHRLPVLPRVHSHGNIRFTNGLRNPIALTHGPTAPNPNSDAITALELSPSDRLTVLHASTSSPYQFYACTQSRAPLPATVRSYVGLSADGMYELVGQRQVAAPGCWQFTLAEQPSMSVFAPTHSSPALVRVLVPILAQYTLYVNRRNELRYLGHRGAVNDENQPIASDIGDVSFRVVKNMLGLTSLAARRKLGSHEFRLSHTNILSRLPPASFLLTRP